MKSARFGVAVFGIGLAVALAVFAYLLDQGRAGARVISGLGEAAEPEREQTLAVPVAARDGADEEDEDVGDEIDSARRALPAKPVESSGLVVHVVDEDGKKAYFADVLAYRGNELLRGDGAMSGTANLIPFDGPGNLRVELHTFEIARLEIPEGRGSYDIVVPRLPRVAGIVRVDGIPRRGIPLYLVDGSDDWLDWIAYGLETAGLHERSSRIHESTEDDGTFCYEGLAPDWSGVLRLANTRDYRFANGAQRLVLARPEEGLVLDVEVLRPELEIRGRVVFAGEPVPAVWELSSGTWGRCDELGRFSIHVFASKVEGLHLEFQQAGLGSRSLEGPELRADLGDVELLPAREIHFVVRSESGEPIAGARAGPRSGPATIFGPFESVQRASKPTDAAGRGVLTSLKPDVSAIRVSARGYALTDVPVPEIPPGPISVVLPRSAAVHVVLRDRTGRVPPGLRSCRSLRSGPGDQVGRLPARGNVPAGAHRHEHRRLGLAARNAKAAARREGAARRQAREVRRLALDRVEAFAARFVQARHRAQQAEGIRVARIGVELGGGGAFDDTPRIHDVDAVGVARHHAQIVRDDEHCHAQALGQALH